LVLKQDSEPKLGLAIAGFNSAQQPHVGLCQPALVLKEAPKPAQGFPIAGFG
jgi:hypothetical protein